MLILKATQQSVLHVKYTDGAGNPATVQKDSVEWGASDPNLLLVEESPGDELTAMVRPAGPLGSGQVNVKCDADTTDEGVKELILTLDVEVVAGDAVTGTIDAEPPTDAPGVKPEGRRGK